MPVPTRWTGGSAAGVPCVEAWWWLDGRSSSLSAGLLGVSGYSSALSAGARRGRRRREGVSGGVSLSARAASWKGSAGRRGAADRCPTATFEEFAAYEDSPGLVDCNLGRQGGSNKRALPPPRLPRNRAPAARRRSCPLH